MTHPMRTICELRATLPATLEALEAFVADFHLSGAYLRDDHALFVGELLLREALTNAVEHGCHREPSRRVRCRARLCSGRLTVAVADDGEGFDWRAAWTRRVDDLAARGRGLPIIRACATRLRFNRSGNAVTILKRF